ncbi:MAG: EamA family transporter [Rhizobiaceae bacterium]
MFALWIPVTIAAAFLQNLRSALQKNIKGRLSNTGAAYVRFFYAWPFALLYSWALAGPGGYDLPLANVTFLVYCALGGLSQILFTVVLLWMFSFRSFAVGTTFSKLEVVLIAILGAILLGDVVSPLAALAITIGAVGTILLSLQESKMTLGGLARGIGEKVTLIGLLSAALLGASVVFFRGAALSLDHGNFVVAASYTLSVSLIMQTLIMGAWFVFFDRDQLKKVLIEWRNALPIGFVGMACSVCWFTAFTLQNAAYVRALGQVELLFTIGASILFFKEKITRIELIAIALIVCAILLILLAS